MKKLLLIALVFSIFAFVELKAQSHVTLAPMQCLSDSVEKVWTARYNTSAHREEVAVAMAVDGAGNVYVTGYSQAVGIPADYLTIKYNAAGIQQWIARYNGPGNSEDYARALAVDSAGNVYVTGASFSGTNDDFATVKYNADGVQQWVAYYNGPGNGHDIAQAMAVDGTGNVYVTGRGTGAGPFFDYATVKYNRDGTELWRAHYNGPGNDNDDVQALAVDGAGNVYVTGRSKSSTSADYATIKYNADGAQQWVARYNGPGNYRDFAQALVVDAMGNVYVTGNSDGGVTTYGDYATVKYNAAGVQQWVARYNGPGNGNDYARSITVDRAGNVYVTGYSSGGATTNDDYATVKYDAAGVQKWVVRYNGSGNGIDQAQDLALDVAGNVYVTGWSWSGTSYDYATVKYDTAGIQKWVARYNGPGNGDDFGQALVVNGAGNVYVAGYGVGASKSYDYATVKYNAAGVEQSVSIYDGGRVANYSESAQALAVDAAGNVYVTGNSYGGEGIGYDYVTLKYNALGVLLWRAYYNGPGNRDDIVRALAVDNAGNVYVTGRTWSGTSDDYATIKYDAAGVQQWVVLYNGPENGKDGALALAVDTAGNVYVTGYSSSVSSEDYATIKYDAFGVQQWVARYNGPGNHLDDAHAIAVDAAGNVYVTGRSFGGPPTNDDYATVKYNSSGVQQWVARYNASGISSEYAKALVVDGAGNIYVTGHSYALSPTNTDYITIKYNASGIQQWVARYNGPGDGIDDAEALAVDSSGNVYVTGQSHGGATSVDYATVKYDASGAQQWAARYNGLGNDYDEAHALAVDGAGNVYVTGYSEGGAATGGDYATVKYNAAGAQQWVARYSGPGNGRDEAVALVVDGTGYIYVTGYVYEPITANDYLTIKYRDCEFFADVETPVVVATGYELTQSYPNPFSDNETLSNPSTLIKFALPEAGKVTLSIYSVTGQLVRTLVDREMPAGWQTVRWNGRDQSGSVAAAGVYLYRIVVQGRNGEIVFNETKRMTVLK
ncbi:MAG: SBBP repeat-containing protein [candidate division KSB1 bacterium]|nr:SBBP repeat-containing protein [candidate division KSB1 bacterium]MDZ7304356.1 SBBP repeat-containing protein [candidate division KSB1 bacterium]MDZ7313669.1 SBBP repeat-containing protein [candidate division KSB1 bacterium]